MPNENETVKKPSVNENANDGKGQNLQVEDMPENNNESEVSQEEVEKPKEPSKLYKAISKIFFLFLLFCLFLTSVATIFALDFLDIWQFRYNIPKPWRKVWPLNKYYDFVQLYQLPDEERYQELMMREKQRYDREIVQGSKELKIRAKELEQSYKTLVRIQKEKFNKAMQELRKKQEEFLKEKAKLEAEKKDLAVRKEAIDKLSKQLASESKNLESSLIRFMEEENRLKQVRNIASVMEPNALAAIFNEVSDNKMIYNILKGMPPIRAGKVLSLMDAEKAGKIMKLGELPLKLPAPGPSRTYIPPSLRNLIASTQAILR